MDPIIYHPDVRYRHKLFIMTLLAAAILLPITAALGILIGNDAADARGAAIGLNVAVVINLMWLVPTLLLIPPYYRSLRYEVLDDEVIVRAGVITRSIKHVPYRMVTNMKLARGPFDRALGLGGLDIQTAGMSGQSGAEEHLAGLVAYSAAYDEVAGRLRHFRFAGPPAAVGHARAASDGDTLSAILAELQAIHAELAERGAP